MNRNIVVMIVSFLGLLLFILFEVSFKSDPHFIITSHLHLNRPANLPQSIVGLSSTAVKKTDPTCKMHNCFNVYKCGTTLKHESKISVYLYPLYHYVDQKGNSVNISISREFYELYLSIAESEFFTDDKNSACIFVPPIDMLNQNNLASAEIASELLATFFSTAYPSSNHLIFNMVPGIHPAYDTPFQVSYDKAILAGGRLNVWTYRTLFDISIPVYSPLAQNLSGKYSKHSFRPYFLISPQQNIHWEYRSLLKVLEAENSNFLLLEKCKNFAQAHELDKITPSRCDHNQYKYVYPDILMQGRFCLIFLSSMSGQLALMDAMSAGCIPVIVSDSFILPFSEVLDWPQASVLITENDLLSNLYSILGKLSPEAVALKQDFARFYYEQYFKSMSTISLATLHIINGRVFPYKARTYEDWNRIPQNNGVLSNLFLPLQSPKTDGFTAVILGYDRLASLFKLAEELDKCPSLALILVVWNNQHKQFPSQTEWPISLKHRMVVKQTTENKLGNRFFPYDEIETECILSIDDDIIMLTTDELEFGYQVWREFPDRLVGFPPRLHLILKDGSLKYESEWVNNVSIVLTGASFYHKFYSHLYTYKMPGDIKDWVDDHMNCEDIAMNFLIANATGKLTF